MSREHTTAMFAGHELGVIVDDGPVPCWRLARPGTDTLAVTITATPQGVVIQCEGAPRKGYTSTIPLSDFVGELDAEYLARMFLTKKWSPTAAEAHFEYLLRVLDADESSDSFDIANDLWQIRERTTAIFDSAVEWNRLLGGLIGTMLTGVGRFDDPMIEENDARVPLDYAPNDVAVLAAVHDRFRALFMQTYRLVERGDVMVPERRTTDE